MVGKVGCRDGERDVGHTEHDLDGTRSNFRMPETLYQRSGGADDKCLRQAELYNAGKQEQEQDGHRPSNSG